MRRPIGRLEMEDAVRKAEGVQFSEYSGDGSTRCDGANRAPLPGDLGFCMLDGVIREGSRPIASPEDTIAHFSCTHHSGCRSHQPGWCGQLIWADSITHQFKYHVATTFSEDNLSWSIFGQSSLPSRASMATVQLGMESLAKRHVG